MIKIPQILENMSQTVKKSINENFKLILIDEIMVSA